MDNPKFYDFLVVRRHIICKCLLVLAMTAGEVGANERTGAAPASPSADQVDEDRAAATAAVQKIQRLLKLLASRYPERYGTVDPGRLDGVFGEETKLALRNFRSIAGLKHDPKPDARLTADILSELASMSANESSEPLSRRPAAMPTRPASAPAPQTADATDCARTPTAPSCDDAKSALTASIEPAPSSLTPEKSEPEKSSKTDIALAEPAREEELVEPHLPREPAEGAMPALPAQAAATARQPNVKLYFVQVASLRSLAAAQREWSRIRETNWEALAEGRVYFERAEVKDRGIFYRILVGPETIRDAANTLCTALKANRQSCVVTSRGSANIVRNVEYGRTESSSPKGTADADSGLTQGIPPPAAGIPAGDAAAIFVTPSGAETAAPVAETGAAQVGQIAAVPHPEPAATGNLDRTVATEARGAGASDAPAPPRPDVEQSLTPAQGMAAAERVPPARPEMAQPSPATAAANPAPTVQGGSAAAEDDSRKYVGVSALTGVAGDQGVTAWPRDLQGNTAHNERNPYPYLPDAVVSAARALKRGYWNLHIILAVAGAALLGALLHRQYRRSRRAALRNALAVTGLPLPEFDEVVSEPGQTIATLEGDFESQQLRDSRRVRDEFLRSILGGKSHHLYSRETGDSAIRVNGSLKVLIVSNPAKYKSIFLNLLFLCKLGTALDRKEIALDQLNNQFRRELRLLQSYFKIHLLELDDRQQIRQRLPGLFYCLQITQPQTSVQSVDFCAA